MKRIWTTVRRCSTSLEEDMERNSTVFGKILRNKHTVKIIYEDDKYLAFPNIKRYAPLACLIIPKRFIPQNPLGLPSDRLELILEMKEIGQKIVHKENPSSFKDGDFWLKFHKPPYTSVEHLHLHVIAPVSQITKWDIIARFCDKKMACDVDDVIIKMRQG